MNQNTPARTTAQTGGAVAAWAQENRGDLAATQFAGLGQMMRPTNALELMKMAEMMSKAGPMIKGIYRNDPGACMALISICAPYGMNPFQVSWKTYKASKDEDAPISYEAQVVVAMINASGAVDGGLSYEFSGEGQKRRVRCFGTLRGSGVVKELWTPEIGSIKPKNSPLWNSDPDQQLCYYAGRAWARRHKPEMLLGIYDVDEDVPAGPDHARDITPKRGGATYVDFQTSSIQRPAEEPPHDPITGEILNDDPGDDPAAQQAEFDRLTALYDDALAAAKKGREAFIAYFNTLSGPDRRTLGERMEQFKVEAEAADAAARAAAEAAEARDAQVDPFANDPEPGMALDAPPAEQKPARQKPLDPAISRAVLDLRKEIASTPPDSVGALRSGYAEQIAAIRAKAPELAATIEAEIDARAAQK